MLNCTRNNDTLVKNRVLLFLQPRYNGDGWLVLKTMFTMCSIPSIGLNCMV